MFPTEYSSLSQLSNEYSIPKSMYFKQVGVTQTMKDDITTKVCLFTNKFWIRCSLLSDFFKTVSLFECFTKETCHLLYLKLDILEMGRIYAHFLEMLPVTFIFTQ